MDHSSSAAVDDDGPGMVRQRFTMQTLKRDALAGTITGLMAIPLNIGIAILSDYPIQIAIFTVVVACIIGFFCSLIRPGNYVGVPGVAAGLAPVLSIGVHRYGIENMAWVIFLVAISQMIVQRYRLERYILQAVPNYLVEGLLAGVGMKIAMKFLPYTYEVTTPTDDWFAPERVKVMLSSLIGFILFVWMYKKLKDRSPGIPYIVVIVGSILLAIEIPYPMLHFDLVGIHWGLPFLPDWGKFTVFKHIEIVLFAMMLSSVDIIEQVMSNAAIEKIDPLGRKTSSNSSLLAIWLANLVSSTFGGMTNLDGLAKSSTNRMAGALTKMSVLFVAAVLTIVLTDPSMLLHLPNFSLAVLMIFTGWKMIAGLYHVAHEGKYPFILATFCAILVFKLGIFEGLLICLALHSFVVFVVYRAEKLPTIDILRKFVALFGSEPGQRPHHHQQKAHGKDEPSGHHKAVRTSHARDLDGFLQEWCDAVNRHDVAALVHCYDTEARLWATPAMESRGGRAHIKGAFESLFRHEGLTVKFESGESHDYEGIFIRSGTYAFSWVEDDKAMRVPARYSFICKHTDKGWFILEHHSSEFPN